MLSNAGVLNRACVMAQITCSCGCLTTGNTFLSGSKNNATPVCWLWFYMSKNNDCITFDSKKITSRPVSNGYWIGPGDGYDGALNGNYQDTEAALIIANKLGEQGYKYHTDFTFVTLGLDGVVLYFYNKQAETYAVMQWDLLTRQW